MSTRPQFSFQRGTSAFNAGLIAVVLVAIVTYFAFLKDIPGTQTYRIQAVVKSSNLLQPRSPVRIAGVDVGKVVKVGRYRKTKYALVTMEIRDNGRPVHKDATIKIRPRLFLEGNFFAELKPGTPDGGEIPEGGVIPVTQTATPVQLDQVLTSLQADTRLGLQKTLKGFGEAVNDKPTAADDAMQDPDVQGMSGGEALNSSFRNGPYALRDGAIVLDALRGQRTHDFSRTIEGIAKATGGLARNEAQLTDLVSEWNTTMAAIASRSPELEQTVKLLGPTAANARKGFASIDRALPATRRFARDLVPGVKETPATIAASDPWLAQAFPLLGEPELGGLLDELGPAGRDLAGLADGQRRWLPRIDKFTRCSNKILIPLANAKIRDGQHTSGVESYKEFWYAMTGQAGESQGFDGNGPFLRVGAPGGALRLGSGNTNFSREPSYAGATTPPLRTSPAFPNKVPPLRRDKDCHTQALPNLNGPSANGPADGSRARATAPASPKREPAVAGRYDKVEADASARKLVPFLTLDRRKGR